MKTRWRVLLILVAVVCFAIALSYPLKYSKQKKDAAAGMERLVELRDAGLAKRGERDDGRMSTSSTEETEKEGAEESELPVESGQSEGFAPSDLQEDSVSADAEPEAEAEPKSEAPVAVKTEAESEPASEAEPEAPVAVKTEAESEPASDEEPEALVEEKTEAEAEPASDEEPDEESEAAVGAAAIRGPESAEEVEPVSEQPGAPGEAEATQERATEPESESSAAETQEKTTEPEPEQSAAETQELPSAAEEAEAQEAEAQAQEGSTQQGEIRREPSGNAQALPEAGSTAAPTPIPTPTSMPTSTPAPTDTPEPTPTVNRFERSGAVSYDQKVKRTLDVDKILPQFQEIYAENEDFAGWIAIPGTDVDYPVVQAEDSDYYLHHDFFGEENVNGQIILDTKCDPYTPSYNLVVSGHNMRSGMMFGNLKSYADEDYWKEHKLVYFDTLMDERTYVVFAAFYSADYDVDETGFRYNADIQYSVDARNWLREVEANQLYDTGIDVEFGDEFLTLTTCNKARRSDGRFVVVCRRLREGEEIG